MKREDFDARGSVAKMLCEVRVVGEQKLSYLHASRAAKKPLPFRLFECIHGEEEDKTGTAVLLGIYRLCPVEAINTFPLSVC